VSRSPPDGLDSALEVLRRGRSRLIDIGLLRYVAHDGSPEVRTFNNIASLGLSGWVDQRVNRARISKLFGGRFAFFANSVAAIITYHNPTVRLVVDDHFDVTERVSLACVCNGQYAGGGMWFAPMAMPDDGQLDLVSFGDASRLELLRNSGAVYRGEHIDHPKVKTTRGRVITATPTGNDPVLLDVDGEAPGRLPASFELLPAALRFMC
jgi:diacylglycerol kinase family enzyme